MTAKEKANELVDKFDNFDVLGENHNGFTAQQCALIAVDEIIKLDMLIDEDTYVMTPSYLQYWEQVKQEIEKL
jgi:hypothetical protein